MPDFKNSPKQSGSVPKVGFFGKLNDDTTTIISKEAALNARVSPETMILAIKGVSPRARMCVGEKWMVFEIGPGKIEVDNIKLTIRCIGVMKKDWLTVTKGLITTNGD
jgi:hypothetical protein